GIEFPDAPAREALLTFEMSVAFIARAHERGDRGMALGQAFQYDGTLRQSDVIGKWSKKTGEWSGGVLWQEISRPQLVLEHICGKTKKRTGRKAIIPLKKYTLVMAEFARLGQLPDIGPIVIDHRTGQPFRYNTYRTRWREIAREVGIPDEVQNRDSRAGGL